jgi:hypothetical protein
VNRRHLLRGALASVTVAVTGPSAGCSEPPPPLTDVVDPGEPAPAPSPTPSAPTAPLSGTPAASEAVAARAAVAVPIRVAPGATPAGLAGADIIYQEYGEAGSLHLAAVFHSREAPRIGPVTEIRPTDVRTLTVLRPFVAYAGGPTGFVSQLTRAGLAGVTPGGKQAAFTGAFTSTAALFKLTPRDALPPPPVFDYATVGTPLATRNVAPAAELSVAVPGRPPQVWRYDAASAAWQGRAGKATVPAASVIVLTMPYRTLSVRKPTSRSLPAAKVFGEGAAVAVSGPSSAKARWRKPGQKLVCHVTDLAGFPIRPRPGTAWVVYAPSNAKVTVT